MREVWHWLRVFGVEVLIWHDALLSAAEAQGHFMGTFPRTFLPRLFPWDISP